MRKFLEKIKMPEYGDSLKTGLLSNLLVTHKFADILPDGSRYNIMSASNTKEQPQKVPSLSIRRR